MTNIYSIFVFIVFNKSKGQKKFWIFTLNQNQSTKIENFNEVLYKASSFNIISSQILKINHHLIKTALNSHFLQFPSKKNKQSHYSLVMIYQLKICKNQGPNLILKLKSDKNHILISMHSVEFQ